MKNLLELSTFGRVLSSADIEVSSGLSREVPTQTRRSICGDEQGKRS